MLGGNVRFTTIYELQETKTETNFMKQKLKRTPSVKKKKKCFCRKQGIVAQTKLK